MPLSRDQTSDPCLVLPPSESQAIDALRSRALFEAVSSPLVEACPALKAREPALAQASPSAEPCEHYARTH
ncbi:hypothetical protein ACLK1G_05980 [Pseudomonas sp. NR3]|uniref:hypothetical protein n=1 Tax=Pseudomonas sp. NR3 TaxID=3155978 RepID=UPI003B6768D2